MGETTGIAWCDGSFNWWWGCTKTSAGCLNCYAERESTRFGFDVWGPGRERRKLSEHYWSEPFRWNRKAVKDGKRKRIFCGSMMDWADPDGPQELRDRGWDIIRNTPMLDWLMLTKRADRIAECLPEDWGNGYPNVWMGVTIENQEVVDKRLALLTSIPAKLRWVSIEPLLERVNIGHWLWLSASTTAGPWMDAAGRNLGGSGRGGQMFCRKPSDYIGWVVVGGESGPGFRQMDLDWVRRLRDECIMDEYGYAVRENAIPFFFKQESGLRPKHLPELDGKVWNQFPLAEVNNE